MTPPCRLCLKLKATQCQPRPGFKLIPASCIILSPTWKLPLSIILSSSSHRCFPPFLPWKLGFRPKKERDTTRAHTRALQGGTRPLWTDAYALSSHVCHYHANIRHQHEAWVDDDVWRQNCKSETRLHYDDLTRRAIQKHLTVWGDIIWLREYELLEYVTLTVSWLLSEWSSSSMMQSISSSLLVATKLQLIQNIISHPQPIPDIHQEQAAPRQRQTHQQEESSFRIPIQTWPSSNPNTGKGYNNTAAMSLSLTETNITCWCWPCVYTHAEKFLLDTHCHHVHKPIGALICTAPEERAVPGWVHH